MTSPLRSMTGFGSATIERESTRAHADVRTVNHRGLRINLRCQANLGILEKELRDAVKGVIHRGNVDINLEIIQTKVDAASLINNDLADSAIQALRDLAKRHGLEDNIRAADILNIPGIIERDTHEGIAEEEWPVVIDALKQALVQAIGMREAEGEATAKIFAEHISAVDVFAREVAARAPEISKQFRLRLIGKLKEIMAAVPTLGDEQAIEREVALMADRVDIAEETDRLQSHVAQFRDALTEGGEMGKRLEFLGQEMLREVNTVASKCSNSAIASQAVAAKLAIEKIKEQVANIE